METAKHVLESDKRGRRATLLLLLSTVPGWAAAAPTLTEKTKEAVQETKAAVEDAGRAAAEGFDTLWQRVDERRLKHRTRFESRRTVRTGYQPAGGNEWVKGVCDKPCLKCSQSVPQPTVPAGDRRRGPLAFVRPR